MKKKALRKDFRMEIKKSKNRFFSILFIVALGVAFFSGIQSSAPDMRLTGDSYFDASNLMDIRVISTLGLTEDDLEALGNIEGVSQVQGCYMEDVYCGEGEVREVLHVESLPEGINSLTAAKGKLPQRAGECFLDASYAAEMGFEPGDVLEISVSSEEDSSLKHRRFTISGCGYSPCYISFNRGSTTLGTGSLSGFMYVLPQDFDAEAYSVAYLLAEGAKEETAFTSGYDDLIEQVYDRVDGIADTRCEVRYNEVMETAQSELDEAKQKVEDGRRELEDGKQELEDGKQELEDAKQELEDGKAEAESELAQAESELLDGETQLEDAKAELEDARQKVTDGEKELASGENEFAENERTLASGKQQIAAAGNTLNSGEAEYARGLEEYNSQAEKARKELEDAQNEINAVKEQLKQGKKQYKENLATVEAGEQAIASAEQELTAQQAAYEEGAAQLAAGQEQYEAGMQQVAAGYEAYNTAVAQLEEQKQNYNNAITALQGAVEAANQAQQECDGRVSQNRSESAALASQLQEAQGTLASLQAVLEILQANRVPANPDEPDGPVSPEHEQELAQAQTRVDEQSAVVVGLQDSITALESEYVNSLQPEQQQKQQAAAAAEATLNATIEQQAGSKAEMDQAEQTLSAQKQTLDATSAALAQTKQELDSRQAELDAAGQQLGAGWEQINTQKMELASARAQLDEAIKTLDASKQEISEGQAQIDAGYVSLGEELAAAEKGLNSARKELDSGWEQFGTSQVQMSDGERQLVEGRQQLTAARGELIDARQQIADGEKEIAENEQKIKEGWADYEEGKIEADEKIADAQKEIDDAEQELLDAEQELLDAEQELLDGEQEIADAQQKIDDIKYPEWYVSDRNVLPEHTGFGENAERLSNIAKVVPILFFLVAALISLTTMTRMVEEERTQIGTLKALGYSKLSIASKYLKYAFWATLGGGISGVLIGEKIFPCVIINAYGIMYHHLPGIILPYNWTYGLIAIGAALFCTIGAAVSACYKELIAVPAQLMRPPAPKEGKRVWLERLPLLWRRLSFTWKSTVRNLFRYKKRFLMTVIGIGGCMGLLLVGYGLQDSIMDIGVLQFDDLQLYDAMVIFDTDSSEQEMKELETTLQSEVRITQYSRFFMQLEDLKTDGISNKEWSVYVYVPEDMGTLDQFLCFRDRETKEPYELTDEGAVITEKISKELGIRPGDMVTVKREDGDDVEVPILAVCENYLSHYLYLTPALYEKVYGEQAEYNSVFFCSDQEQSVIEEIGETLLEKDAVLNVTYTGTLAEQIDNMLGALDVVMIVLIISAGMLAFVVLYNLNNININERRRELATLKVLGFYNGEVAAYVYRENILLSLIGAALGIFLGKVLHAYIITTVEVDACMFGRNINLPSFVYGTLFTIGFSAIVNVVMYFKLKKIDMVESLKSIE